VGDQVSVRAYRSGAALIATRVHVYASSRQSHTLVGVVTGVSGARLTIQVRGRRYTVVLSRGTALTIAGRPGSPSGVRVGDHIRAVGHLTGSTLAATRVSVTRPAAKTVVVHGTVSAIGSGDFWLTDSRGAHYHVRPGPGVQPTLHGSRAPADALFVGVRVTAHGPVVNGVLLASSIAISVTVQTVAGRVAAVRGTRVSLARSPATTIGIDVPPGMRISDGARRDPLSALHQGTYLHVRGYAETGGRIRASSISILHPALDITGTILAVTPDLVMQTAAGERYTLVLSASTPVAVQHSQIDVSKADIAVGDHVHIQGTARSDGAVAVQQISVRLASVTLRGAIASLSNEALSLTVSGATEQVRLQSKTTVTQGSHSLAFGDLVAGDDLTVYGYRSGQGWVIARKLEVHRKLVGLDGFVSAIEPQGFALTLTGGSVVHVRTDATTQESGGVVVVGLNVHVTGYRRGDGVVLATRVKVGKPHQQLADFLTDPSVVEQGAHGLEALHQAPSIVLG
jgi:hypothetical protein